MRKVLIITYSFPPLNDSGAHQWGRIVSYMPEFGWRPIVLTTESEGSLPVLIPENDIIRLGEHRDSKKVLVSEGDYRGIPGVVKPFYFLYKKWGMNMRSIDRFLFDWGKRILNNINLIKEINPDVILTTCYPAASLWVGHRVSKKINKPWLADFRDACSLWNDSKFPFLKFLDRKIDKFLLKNATLITTVSPYLASVMESFYKKPVKVIYNGFDKIKVPVGTKNILSKRRNKIIYYAGRFQPHRLKSVKLLIDWLANNKEENFNLIIRSVGPIESNEEILNYAKEKNISSKINLLEPTSPDIISQEEEKADISVLFEDLGELGSIWRGTMPGKLFEYLPYQAPILSIARGDSDMGIVLKDTSRGYLVSNASELETAMNKILKGNGPDSDWEKVKNYSHQSQSKALCGLLDQILEK